MQDELATNGFPGLSTVLTSTSAKSESSAAQCNKKFRHWCLDGTSLDKADVGGIIAAGCAFVILVALGLAFNKMRQIRRRKAAGRSPVPYLELACI